MSNARISRSKSFGPLFTNEMYLWHHRLYLTEDSIFLCIALEWSYVCVCAFGLISCEHTWVCTCMYMSFLWWHHLVFFLRQELSLAWRSLSRWGCLGSEAQGFTTSPPSHRWDYKFILRYMGFCCPCRCLFSKDSGAQIPVLMTNPSPAKLSFHSWVITQFIVPVRMLFFFICAHSYTCGLCLWMHVCGLAGPCGRV